MIKLASLNNLNCLISKRYELGNHHITVSTDSRNYLGESLFVAITGVHFNAFEFIEKVISLGCKNIVFTDSQVNNELLVKYETQNPDINFIKVSDSIIFLQQLAHEISNEFQRQGKKLICICGSNGKTTTKEMLYSILKNIDKKVICTQKNNNNHIGVPLTIFQITDETQFAIIELGSNHPGEIKTLCEIANPSIGVTTNIGLTHMEFFEELEDVFTEEGYLYHYINDSSSQEKIFFKNIDDQFLASLPNSSFCVNFGTGKNVNGYQFEISNETCKISYGETSYEVINTHITGKHNFYNLCLSIAVAHKVSKVSFEKIVCAAQKFMPTKNRSQWLELKNAKVFLDAYNANPSSMRAAIDGFRSHLNKNNKPLSSSCLILGDMYELGANTEIFHKELGAWAASLGFGKVIFVGRFANFFILDVNSGEKVETCEKVEDLKKLFIDELISVYSHFFIKGSRSLQLESLIDIT